MKVGQDKFSKRRNLALLTVFVNYMKLYLQTYKGDARRSVDIRGMEWVEEVSRHEKIRKHFTAEELSLLDNGWPLSVVWDVLRTKPEFLSLLAEEGNQISDVYHHMSAEQLVQESERAAKDIARTSGLMLFAPSGWGKSRLLGRSICYQHAVNKVGCVVLDVVGATIDNALDKIARHTSITEQQEIGSRIRYCNMAGERINGDIYVTSWPMLIRRYRGESLYTTSQRIVDLIAKTDRNLSGASIQGLNRIAPLLTSIAILLANEGLPISYTFDLLEQPEELKSFLNRTHTTNPEVWEAAQFLRSFVTLPPREQEQRSDVLRNKLSFLRFDLVSRAIFSAREPLIDWEEVATKGLQVYIDLRGTDPMQVKELKLFWVWNSLMEYIQSRGAGGRYKPPLAVVIDELSYFVRGTQLNTEAISEEFREFVQVRRRNANILLTAATQERSELPPAMQSACLQLPSHLYGATFDPQTALENANRWYTKNPKRTKSRGILYLLQVKEVGVGWHGTEVRQELLPLEYTAEQAPTAYMTLEEQEYESSRNFLELAKGEWLFAKSPAEGVPPTGLEHITTAKLDDGEWVREAVVAEMRRRLMQQHGIPVSAMLAELTTALSKIQQAEPEPEQPHAPSLPPKPEMPDEPLPAHGTGRRRAEE